LTIEQIWLLELDFEEEWCARSIRRFTTRRYAQVIFDGRADDETLDLVPFP
jgi:hypothetical protein